MNNNINLEKTLKNLALRAEAFVEQNKEVEGLGITNLQAQLLSEWSEYVQALAITSAADFYNLWADFESDYRFLPSAILVTQEDADNIMEYIDTPEVSYTASITNLSDFIGKSCHAARQIQAPSEKRLGLQ